MRKLLIWLGLTNTHQPPTHPPCLPAATPRGPANSLSAVRGVRVRGRRTVVKDVSVRSPNDTAADDARPLARPPEALRCVFGGVCVFLGVV